MRKADKFASFSDEELRSCKKTPAEPVRRIKKSKPLRKVKFKEDIVLVQPIMEMDLKNSSFQEILDKEMTVKRFPSIAEMNAQVSRHMNSDEFRQKRKSMDSSEFPNKMDRYNADLEE